MARMKEEALKTNDLHVFDPAKIRVEEGWNPRHKNTEDYEAGILELMASILENGVQMPLFVAWKDGVATVKDGHRRMEALTRLRALGHTGITVRLIQEDTKLTDEDYLAMSAMRNDYSVPFTPIELAELCVRLTNAEWPTAKIAAKIGKSLTYVEDLRILATASPVVIGMLDRKEVSPSSVIQAIKDRGVDGATDLLADATAKAALLGKEKATPKIIKQVKSERAAEAAAVLAQGAEDEPDEEAPDAPEDSLESPEEEIDDTIPSVPAAKPAPTPAKAPVEAAPASPAAAPQLPQEPSKFQSLGTAPIFPEEGLSDPGKPEKPARAPKPTPAPAAEPLDYKKVAMELKKHLEAIFVASAGAELDRAISKAAAYHGKIFPQS